MGLQAPYERSEGRGAEAGTLSFVKDQRAVKGKLINYFSRKFVLALACLGLGFYLSVVESKEITSFITLVGVILGFYNGANVIQSHIQSKNPNSKNEGDVRIEQAGKTTNLRSEETRGV